MTWRLLIRGMHDTPQDMVQYLVLLLSFGILQLMILLHEQTLPGQ
jgi:hypothetical protein